MADEQDTTQEQAAENTAEETETSTEETSENSEATESTAEATTADAENSEGSDAGQSDVDESVEVPEEFQQLVEQVENMTVLQLNELVKVLEKRFGVSAAAVAAPAAGGGAAEEAEAQNEFDVELTDVGGQKIGVIKVVKEALGLGLKEAKEMADNAPSVLQEKMPKEQAEELKGKLEEAGATVTLK